MRARRGDGGDGKVSPNDPWVGDPAAGGRRMGLRPFFLAAAAVVGAVVPWHHGLFTAGLKKAMGATRLAAAAAPAPAKGGGSDAPGTPAPNSPPPAGAAGKPPAAPAPGLPPADSRAGRALHSPVHLLAGAGSLWTELRFLGVRPTWPENGEPQWNLDERTFNRGLRRLGRRVERFPRNARLLHTASGFHALPARPGRMLDRAAARRQLLTALAEPTFRQSLDAPAAEKPRPITLTIPLHEVAPSVTGVHLGGINTVLAAYSTSLGGSSRNRRHNIRVACEAIDGTVLMPGDVFSYNETVGPRTERAGFRTAPVIIHGELVPGTGGGVCQVSSTLYNAALLGDLKIVRRTHHHFPVHYVPAGRDATVAYGSLDLRFANSLPRPVALDVKCAGSRVVVHLYGSADCKREVQLVSHRVSGPRRRASVTAVAKRVVVTRVVRLADGGVRREVVSRDSYAPAPSSSHITTLRRTPRRRRHPTRRQEPGETAAPVAPNPPIPTAATAPNGH